MKSFTLHHMRPYAARLVAYGLFVVLSVLFTMATALSVADFLKILFPPAEGAAVMPSASASLLSQGLGALYQWLASFGPERALVYFSIVLLGLYAFKNVFGYLAAVQMSVVRCKVVRDIRSRLFHKMLHLPLAYFGTVRKGDILARFGGDIVEYDESMLASFQQLLTAIVSIVLYLVMLFYISTRLTLFVLCMMPIIVFVISGLSHRLRRSSRQLQNLGAFLTSLMEETIVGLKVVKAYTAIDFSNRRFQEADAQYARLRTRVLRRIDLSSPVSDFLGNCVVIGILLFGSSMVLRGDSALSSELFVSYIMMFVLMIPPAKELTTAISQMKKGRACVDRLQAILDDHLCPISQEYVNCEGVTCELTNDGSSPQLTENDGNRPNSQFSILNSQLNDGSRPNSQFSILNSQLNSGSRPQFTIHNSQFTDFITFSHVSFSYTPDVEVLHDITLDIPRGATVALVGSSGSGKSTLADLLLRFHRCTAGQILIDGRPIDSYPLHSYRSHIGVVSQQTDLFNDTIRNNIAYGHPSATLDQVERAARIANAHQFILATPQGYDTNIGDGGALLSGGQRQRLSIARAVLSNPDILVLDEATSALDTESEHLVQQSLDSLMSGRTSLIIAHRLSTIQHADLIVVLEQGRIVEQEG